MFVSALIGLGNIAWKYDAQAPAGLPPLSQGGAMLARSDLRLAGGCSPEPADRSGFAAWRPGLAVFSEAEEMLAAVKPDLVGLCSPTELHFHHARLCLEAGVKALWLEKPPTATPEELTRLTRQTEECGAVVLVNYSRRYLPVYQRLRQCLASGRLGPCRLIRLMYSPGLARNGVHLLDQLFFLTGADDYEILWVERGMGLASPGFALRLSTGHLVEACGGDLPYHTNDLAAVCEQGVLAINRGGKIAHAELSRENDLYPGFYDLHDAPDLLGPGGLTGAMDSALADLVAAMTSGRRPESNLYSAALTQRLMDDLLRGCRP